MHQKQSILEAVESEDYQHAVYVFKGMLERYQKSCYQALLFLQLEGFPAKQKKYGKQALQYVLDMLLLFFKECMKKESACQDMWYKKQLETMQQKDMDIIKIMQILIDVYKRQGKYIADAYAIKALTDDLQKCSNDMVTKKFPGSIDLSLIHI